ncbi:MAG: hypothetical protein JSS27_03060 [Planctomycetes bacterium]|nr:hypothetical protein [Planctomycetota bacterium]
MMSLGNRPPRSDSRREPIERSEGWKFAQAILGRPVPDEREYRQFLADISPDHADQLRRELAAEAAARADEEFRSWLRDVAPLHEAEWNPAKHPRRGSQPNPGWFAPTGGEGDHASNASAPSDAALINRRPIVAQFTAASSGDGHHFAARAAIYSDDVLPKLGDDALTYAAGRTSGATNPSHSYGKYGGIKHGDYTKAVKQEILKFIERKRIKKMTKEQMEEFINLIESGKGSNGRPHDVIGPFNRAIKKAVPRGTKVVTAMDDVMANGRRIRTQPRFNILTKAAIASAFLGEAIAAQASVLQVAGTSGHYRRAMEALDAGDLVRAQSLLTGDNDSLYMEILTQVGAYAALNFRSAVDEMFERLARKEYK